MGAYLRTVRLGKIISKAGASNVRGFTIIEVMLFFAVTGALMLGVLGSASVGVNTQRYNDAVNTFAATVQQEFTNVTNVVNTKSDQDMCTNASNTARGVSNCVIIGRLMTINDQGDIISSNLVGDDSAATTDVNATEIQVVRSYQPNIDVESQEKDRMSWGTKIEKPSAPFVSLLIVRSPRSGNVYSYVSHGLSVVSNKAQLDTMIAGIVAQGTSPQNAREQYMCIDRSGWVATPVRVVKLAPYTAGPSGVSTVDVTGSICA